MPTQPAQRRGRSKQDYGTPPELLSAVKRRLGITAFDWDLAADYTNAVATSFYSIADDGLSQPWPAGWNWLNPPFARIAPWVERARREWIRHDVKTAVLIPAAVGSNWWRDHVHEYASVLFLNPRVRFVGCADPYPKDCAVLLYGAVPERYEVWNWREHTA